MVACKVIVAVVLMMSVAQINCRPAETDFESTLKNVTSSINALIGEDGQKYTDLAKTGYNQFVDNFKSGLSSLSKTFDGKTGVSDVVKEATKQWQTAVDTYSKNLSPDLTSAKLTEKFEKSLKYITDNAAELSKKAQGNTEIEKDIKKFTEAQIESLLKQVQSVKSSILGEKKA